MVYGQLMAWPTRAEVRDWGEEAQREGNREALDAYSHWENSLPYRNSGRSPNSDYLKDALAIARALGRSTAGYGPPSRQPRRTPRPADVAAAREQVASEPAPRLPGPIGRPKVERATPRPVYRNAQRAGQRAAAKVRAAGGSKAAQRRARGKALRSALGRHRAKVTSRDARGRFQK